MGTIRARQFIDQMGSTLRDDELIQWTEGDGLAYLSAAQRAAVELRPEINSVTETYQLVAGTRQTIPVGAFSLLDVIRNMGLDGETPGRAVRIIDRVTLDESFPNWHMEPIASVCKHYVYDIQRSKDVFYVYPVQPVIPCCIEIAFSAVPAEIVSTDVAITLDDVYESSLYSYMLYRAYSKQVNTPGSANHVQMAQFYYRMFVDELTGGRSSEAFLNPDNKVEVGDSQFTASGLRQQ